MLTKEYGAAIMGVAIGMLISLASLTASDMINEGGNTCTLTLDTPNASSLEDVELYASNVSAVLNIEELLEGVTCK